MTPSEHDALEAAHARIVALKSVLQRTEEELSLLFYRGCNQRVDWAWEQEIKQVIRLAWVALNTEDATH